MFFYLTLISLIAHSNELIKVAVIDTGLDLKDRRFKDVLCPEGHKDFTGTGIKDHHGHGTHVAGLIKEYADSKDYCLIILKYFDPRNPTAGSFAPEINEAIKQNVSIINISGGGYTPSIDEKSLIENNQQITFVVSAGNDGNELDEKHTFYPASYHSSNVIVVGSLNDDGHKSRFSNYGKSVTAWEVGENVLSMVPNGWDLKSGTSMSSAIRTGKIINAFK